MDQHEIQEVIRIGGENNEPMPAMITYVSVGRKLRDMSPRARQSSQCEDMGL